MRVPERVGNEEGYYRVGGLLGHGSMGAVYVAHDDAGRPLAIKFLHEHLLQDPRMVERFAREARLARRVRSEHVARVLAAGRNEGLFWIAYERFAGDTLEQRLQRLRVLPVIFARTIVEQLLLGLEAAHGAGVVHRDIKPANVFLRRLETSESACILDFGISKIGLPHAASTNQTSLTSATETLGTWGYIAPEQIEGAATVGPRADLYSTGTVAYRALTGMLPLAGATHAAVLYAKRHGDPRTLAQATREAWPASTEAFFRAALARHPDHRFSDARRMREAWFEATTGDRFPSLEILRSRAPEPSEHEQTLEVPLRREPP